MTEASQESSTQSEESAPPSRRRELFEIVFQQVVGAVVAGVLTGVVGWGAGVFSGMGSADGDDSGGSDGYRQTFAGRLTLKQTIDKDIDTPQPTDAHGPGGDVRFARGYATLEGVKIAPYRGSGTPTADRCDQAAQANGDASEEVRTQGWYCIRSAKGAVAALRVDAIGVDAIDGYAIVWRR
ncbi:hypothetical protein D0T12_34455 [Actinomadura spongiicola]|uniref:Uncharacterized protein n=1 Tax=Actinomadura spongiicola TaxID=2303421 RepID=A0A372G6G7_9ACTN|nr:hypothetical protein [Actinomadura spongiicola]RFS80975.1 hypothetical protein D0T12_34455 [Actinomadura spongiicola]